MPYQRNEPIFKTTIFLGQRADDHVWGTYDEACDIFGTADMNGTSSTATITGTGDENASDPPVRMNMGRAWHITMFDDSSP